ncbi:histidine kinase N-terminal 7TM domain-containing protein [Aquiflexum gelatinilyticum]|uniref:sensor histidine kinase n=1 Tax=Aquiflexum gelatinilyticum TaxID=2961943 RepID=UPI00216974D5|nr:histidine kinase N-terminal 7TM domain-containing protein [Aquiflexum gelatinilyticum]MCS4433324.1 ATP-binding protein [Aquiflexum gelatinilyticum]
MELNIFSVSLLFSGIIVAAISTVIIYRLGDSVRWFAFTMLFVSIWALAYGFELSSKNLETMLFWIKIEYIGIALAPGAWLWFCLKYTGLERYTHTKFALLVFGIPVITYFMVFTNSFHHLHYRNVMVDNSGPFPLLAIQPGPWYFIHLSFFYISLFFGIIILLYKFKNADPVFKKQNNLLLLAGLFPWAFNIFYLLGFRPFGHIDLTPYAFLIMYIFVGIGLIRFDLFSIKPIARDKVFEVISKGILVLDPNSRIIDFNPFMTKILERPVSNFIGKRLEDIFGKDSQFEIQLNEQKKISIESSLSLTSGQKDLSVEYVPINDKKGNSLGMMIIFEDITQKKSIQNQIKNQAEELKNLNSLKDKLFTIISHDLKGPIFGIRELIKLSFEGVISQKEFLDILPEINKNMDSVSILLENLLAWTSSQLKGEFLEKRIFELDKLVDQQVSLFEKKTQEKGITLSLQKYGNLQVYADKNMIDLAIRNLISNAIKFSGKGDLLTVFLKENEDNVTVKIKDTGLGISEENLQKLRNRESFTTIGKDKESGTGLGMLLVHDYVIKNGGELKIQSQHGKGSEFSFSLPKNENS